MEYQCGSCGDSYDTAVSHYTCGANPTHNLCIVCFGVFAAHCCSAAAGGLSILIPMTCFIPSCKSLIPDNEISRLLQDETIKEQRLWDRYLKSQLMVALNGQIQNSSAEIPITCSFCNEYIEMYAPVEAVVWEKQQKKLESELEEELVKVRIEIEAETAKRFEGRKDELNSQIEHLKRQYLDEGGSEDDHKTLLENIARMGFRGDEFDIFLMEIKEKKYESVDTTSINTEVVVDFINAYEFTELSDTQWESLKKYYLFSMKEASIFLNIKERISSITKEIIAVEENRRSEISTKVQAYKSEFFKRRREAMIVLPDKPSESSQFFMCRNASCMGAFCLRCEVFLTKDAILDHICQIDAVHELYKEVLHILAENSTRRCPTCGQMWRKDLECTQMTCGKCQTKFCYVCGRAEAEIREGFTEHYNWYLKTDESLNRCPLYLHWKYGEFEAGGRMQGDPATCLHRFHEELQKKAIAIKEASADKKLWEEMILRNFPSGIFSTFP